MKLVIELSDFDAAVFGLVADKPAEWAANAVRARVLAKKNEMADIEAARRRRAGEPALSTLDDLVAAALKQIRDVDVPDRPAPDNPTLSDWRVALALWGNAKGKPRLDEVSEKVAALVADGNPLGRIARERLEYANNVLRAQLVQLKTAFGFTDAEVEESLWRADRVRQGDLSGVWPLVDERGA